MKASMAWLQKQPVEFDGFGTHGYMLYSLGYTCTVLNPQKSSKTRGWILMDFGVVNVHNV